ncbi:concanavalin A-like lectin/glucanase [Microthyrium microscopicum]|uniref:Concanavalin A-like lectin/glucanase n=1 Tax=Microthyrium microscopicum TaxID=703497 RepID=A0A6A6UM23_9PEZI|nr:concanavalin A-like lectin/glucanase [Microthyrium microscopicum]
MSVTTDPKTPAQSHYASNFSATWGFPQGDVKLPVHAFPNALLADTSLPVQLSSLKSLPIDLSWNYDVGSTSTKTLDLNGLLANNLNANVCVDIFLDDDKTEAASPSKASHEIMVWFGQIGLATQPLGTPVTPAVPMSINGTDFTLYYGQNPTANSQSSFTWVADKNTTSFTGDLMPLVTALTTQTDGPNVASYIGYYAFGSETYYAASNMTFTVSKLDIDINTK